MTTSRKAATQLCKEKERFSDETPFTTAWKEGELQQELGSIRKDLRFDPTSEILG